MRKLSGWLVALAWLVLSAVDVCAPGEALGQAPRKDKVSLLLNWYTYGEHAPFAYGVVKGFYAEQGIELEIKEGAGSGVVVQAVGSGAARFGYADAGSLAQFASKGLPVRMIANYIQTTPLSMIFYSEKGINSPKDLEGKKIAATPGGAGHLVLPLLFKANNVDQSKVHLSLIAEPKAKQAALMTGVIDAMEGYFTTQVGPIELETNRKVGYIRFADFGVNSLSQGLLVHGKHLGERELNCRMVRATSKAWTAAGQDPEGAAQALHKLFPKTNKENLDLTKRQWLDSFSLLYTKHTQGKTPGWMAQEDWDNLLHLLKTYGGMEKLLAQDAYYTNEFFDCK